MPKKLYLFIGTVLGLLVSLITLMNLLVRQKISVLREHFYNASHFDQIWMIIILLFVLSLPFYLFVSASLMGEIFVGIFFGVWIIDHLWRNKCPAFKRWIAEKEYRRQILVLWEHFYQSSRPNKLYSVGVGVFMPLLLLILLVAVHLHLVPSLRLLLFWIMVSIIYSICTLGFIDEVCHEWYPSLKQKPGIRYTFLTINFILGIAAYALAYEYINFLTKVDPGNFIKALIIFTTIAMVPVWTIGIAMMAGVIAIGSMIALPVIDILSRWHIIDLWYWIRNRPRVRSLFTLPLAEKRDFPMTRFAGRALGAFGIFAVCSLLCIGLPPVKRAVHITATTVLVWTQFSYDQTCAVSSEHRRVAYLKDRKEMTASIVSIADIRSWPDISFTTGTCLDAIQP
jgi:hypothetical protein